MSAGLFVSNFEDNVSKQMLARGRAYYRDGQVRAIETGPGYEAHGVVYGRRPYAVTLEVRGDEFYVLCRCSAFEDDGVCEHLIALAYETDASGLSEALLRASATQGPIAWSGGERSGEGPSGTRSERRSRPDWRTRLVELEGGAAARREAESSRKASSGARRTSLFELWLDPDDCRQYAGLVLSLSRRPGLKNGGHGEAREAKWGNLSSFRSMSAEVRAALERVARAGDAEAFGWRWSGRCKLLLPPEKAVRAFETLEGIVPVRVRTGLDQWSEPLKWEPDPWRFGLVVGRGEQDGDPVVRVEGELHCGPERVPLSEAHLLLARSIVVLGDRVAPLDDAGAFDWISSLRRDGELEVGHEEIGPFLAKVLAASHGVPLDLGDLAEGAGEPEATLDLSLPAGKAVEAKPFFTYGALQVAAANPSPYLLDPEAPDRVLRRSGEGEDKLLEVLEAAGCVRSGPEWVEYPYRMPREDLAGRCRRLLKAGWQVRLERKPLKSGGSLSLRVRSGIDWFDIEGEAAFEQSALSLPEILRAVAAGKGFVTLADGGSALLPPEWTSRLEALGALSASRSGAAALRVSRARAPLLDILLADLADVEGDEAFQKLQGTLRSFKGVRALREPRTFHGELRGYQRDALGWFAFLRKAGLGGCLADDMGLGKTIQVLACLLTRRRAKGRRGPSLVVAPRSVMSNWTREAERFAPSLRCAVYHGAGRADVLSDLPDLDLIVTTYGTMQRDIEALSQIAFDYAILDESQAIKNAASKTARAARLLDAENRLALSGTPIENHLEELGSLFAFLNPGLLGSKREFQRLLGSTGTPPPERLAWLQAALRPVILRRTREQVLTELPQKEEQILMCRLEGEQRKAYDSIRKHYRASVLGHVEESGLAKSKMHVLEALLRLRQAACHPGLIDASRAGESAAKLEQLLPMLEEIAEAGHKALVFSQFTSFLAILRRSLDERGLRYEYLDGKTKKRSEPIDRFQEDPAISAFLISLKAGGTGLNLTAAQYVFLLDPWWNPAVESQAVGRAHRMGQQNPVTVYRLIGEDTVEDRVLELQARKRDLVQAVLGGVSDAPLRGITRDDLELLLG